MLLSNRKEVARTTPRGPNSFYPGQDTLRSVVVLTFCRPLKASRWFPYAEETGRKIFRSNG